MSENQYLEIIENKLDNLSLMIDQQSKSGVFFDGFTKQVLERINDKLEHISNFENNELLNYLTSELRKTFEARQNAIQQQIEGVQGQINNVQANLSDSLKTPELATVFTRLSDSIIDFSRDLNAQNKYFNSAVEQIQTEIGNIDVDSKLSNQTEQIRAEISAYKTNIANLSDDINGSFDAVRRLIQNNSSSEAIVALSGDITVVQKGLNDIVNAVLTINTRQGELISSVANISANSDVQDIRLDVSSIVAEMQALKDTFRALVNKADIEALNEKLNFAIESVSNLRELSSYNDSQNKSAFQAYFEELNNLLASLVSREEGELIKSKLDYIKTGLESGHQNVVGLIEQNSSEIKNLIPVISSLSTRENIQSLSENAMKAIENLTQQWNEKFSKDQATMDLRFEAFNSALSNLYAALATISEKVDKNVGNSGAVIKEEINSIITQINDMGQRVASSASAAIGESGFKITELSNAVNEKTANIEALLKNSHEDLKEDFDENITQIKNFAQNLFDVVIDLGAKFDDKSLAINSVLNERYDSLSNKIKELNELYSTSEELNKVEILNSINSLRTIVEASRQTLDNEKIYNLLKDKVNAFENLLQEGKEENISANKQITESLSAQSTLLEALDSNLKDIVVKLSDANQKDSLTKEDIISEVSQKAFNLSNLIAELKNQVVSNLAENRDALKEDFTLLKTTAEEMKALLDDVNQNQASKEILNSIFDNVYGKINEVTEQITVAKDLSSVQYDGIKGLTAELKNDIADITVLLNQSSEFSNNLMNKIAAGFVENSANIEGLKNDIINIGTEQKQILTASFAEVQGVVTGLDKKADEIKDAVKEENLSLREAIEQYQSNLSTLSDINFSSAQQETRDFIQEELKGLKEKFVKSLTNVFENISFMEESEEIQSVIVENAENIKQELSNVQSNSAALLSLVLQFEEKAASRTFIVEQIDKVNEIINKFEVSLSEQLNNAILSKDATESNNLKAVLIDLQQQINDSVNYFKEVNLNLDKGITATQNNLIQNVDLVKEEVAKAAELVDSSKVEIITQIQQANEAIDEKFQQTQSQTETAKNELLTELSGSLSDKVQNLKTEFEVKLRDAFDMFGEKIANLTGNFNASSQGVKEELQASLEELKTTVSEVKTDLEGLFATSEMTYAQSVNGATQAAVDTLKQSLQTLSDELVSKAVADKEVLTQELAGVQLSLDAMKADYVDVLDQSNLFIKAEVADRLSYALDDCSQKIDDAAAQIQDVSDKNKEQIVEEVKEIKYLIDTHKGSFERLENALVNIKDIAIDDFTIKFAELNTKTAELIDNIKTSGDKIGEGVVEQVRETITSVSNVKEELIGLISSSVVDLLSKMREFSSLNKDEILAAIDKINLGTQELKDTIESIKNDSATVKEDLSDFISVNINTLIEKLNTTASLNREEILFAVSQINSKAIELKETVDTIKNESSSVKEEISSAIFNTTSGLVEKINNAAALDRQELVSALETVNTVSSVTKEEILSELEKIKAGSQTLKEIFNEFGLAVDSTKEDLATIISNAAGELFERINNNSSFNKEEIISELEKIKSGSQVLKEVFDEFSLSVDSTKEDLTVVITKATGDLLEQVKINSSVNKEELISELEKIKAESQVLKETFDGFGLVTTSAKEEVLAEIQKVKSETQELRNTIGEFRLVSNSNKEDLITLISNTTRALIEKITDNSLNKEEIVPELEKIKSDSQELKEIFGEFKLTSSSENDNLTTLIVNTTSELVEQINENASLTKEEVISALETVKTGTQELKDNLAAFQENTSFIKENLSELISEKTKVLIDKISNTSSLAKGDIVSELENIKTGTQELKALLDNVTSSTISNKEDMLTAIENTTNDLVQQINENSSVNKSEILSSLEQINVIAQTFKGEISSLNEAILSNAQKSELLTNEVKEILNSSFNNISEVISKGQIDNDEFKEGLKFEIKKSIDEISEKLLQFKEDNGSVRDALLYEFQKAFNTIDERIINQSAKTDKQQTAFSNTLYERIDNLETGVQSSCSSIKTTLFNDIINEINIGALKEEISKKVIENASSISNKISELHDEFDLHRTAFDSVLNTSRMDYLSQLVAIKEEVQKIKPEFGALAVIEQVKGVEEKLQTVSDDIINTLSKDVTSGLEQSETNIAQLFEDKLSYIKDDINEVILKLSSIDTIVDRVKDIVVVQFEDYFGSFENRVNDLEDDLRKHIDKNISKVTTMVDDYKSAVESLDKTELLNEIKDTSLSNKNELQSSLAAIDSKVESVNNDTREIKDNCQKILGNVDDTSKEFFDGLENLRNIITAEVASGEDLEDNFNELRDVLDDLGKKTLGIEDVIKNENATLREIITRYQEELDVISSIDVDVAHQGTKDFVKAEIRSLKEQFVKNLAVIFENISFIEESEEIQSVIYDNTDDIKKEISKLQKELVENLNSTEDIDRKFNNLKTILESITTGSSADSSDYIYTLPDVETDIAKMRMAINDINDMLRRNREDGYDVVERLGRIDDIRDDIASISKRTNKLILASEDSNKYLKENIGDFKKVIENIDKKCSQIEESGLNKNVSEVKALVMSGLKSDKILNEAFMHLAEWIDESARNMNTITEQVQDNKDELKSISRDIEKLEDKADEIGKLKDAVYELSKKISGTTNSSSETDYSKFLYDIECGLDKISDKLEVQELKIKTLEKKLDNVSNLQNGNEEISSVLEFIASQVSAANENSRSNRVMLQKIEMLEKQMNQFESSISKITAFIDDNN